MQKALLCVSLVCCLGLGAVAQEAAESPRARIEKAMAYAAGRDAFSVSLELRQQLPTPQGSREAVMSGRLMARGEIETFIEILLKTSTGQIYSDNTRQCVYLSDREGYVELEPLVKRANLIGILPGGALSKVMMWLGRCLENDTTLLDEAKEIQAAGEEKIPENGSETPCSRFTLTYPEYSAELWLQDGPTPLPRRLRMTALKGGPSAEIALNAWDTAPAFAEGQFAFVPPEGVERMPNISALSQRRPKDTLIGQPAPAVQLDLLEGGKLDLAAHQGKNIVVLDFWASWCRPCRMAMPMIEEAVTARKDRGVVLYAVNLREPAEKIRAFLEQAKLPVTVALDPEGRAGAQYGAASIPRIVVIDKRGVVRYAHSGIPPNFQQSFAAELDTLLSE